VKLSYHKDANGAYLHLGEETLRPIKTVAVPDIDPWRLRISGARA